MPLWTMASCFTRLCRRARNEGTRDRPQKDSGKNARSERLTKNVLRSFLDPLFLFELFVRFSTTLVVAILIRTLLHKKLGDFVMAAHRREEQRSHAIFPT